MILDWNHVLLEQFDLEWNLAHGPSLETLTDDEYLWEPVPGCWSIRPTGTDGRGELDQAWPDPEPSPEAHLNAPWASLVLHVNREALHHLAEVSLLRDLYRVTGGARLG